jgi:hypothetical protein
MIGCPQPERLCKVSGRQAGSSLRGGHHSVRILVSAIMAIALSLMGSTAAFAAPGAPTWTDSTLATIHVTVAYSDGVSAAGHPTPTYSVVPDTLPDGLTLDPTSGAVTGTPTTEGEYDFIITATNGVEPDATQEFTGTVWPAGASQTVAFTSTAPTAATIGGPAYTPTVHATSGLAAVITVDASASSICSISGGIVSFLAAGSCVLDANQAGDETYNPAPQVQQSFDVGKASQTVAFTSTAPTAATIGGPTYTPTAHATSGLAAVITVDASASSICSISGGIVSFLAAGSCVLDANQAGNSEWSAATQVQQSFDVASSTPGSFLVVAPGAVGINTAFSVTVTAKSGSGGTGTTVTGYTGTIHFTSTDPAAVLPADYTFVSGDNGVHTFTNGFRLKTVGGGAKTITARDTVATAVTGVSGAITISSATGATFHAISPARVLDTRPTGGGVTHVGILTGPFVAGAVRTFDVANAPHVGGSGIAVPTGAVAVTGNITITGQTAAGVVALGPTMTAVGDTTTVNFSALGNRACNVTIGLGPNGTLQAVFRGPTAASTNVIFDVTGYFTADSSGATYHLLTPGRVLDSRGTGSGHTNIGLAHKFFNQVPRTFNVVGVKALGWSSALVPAGAVAVTGNVTVTNATSAGFVSVGSTVAAVPKTSTLNVAAGANIANGVTVALGAGKLQAVWVGTAGSSADIIFDVTGYFTADLTGLAFHAIAPERDLDTSTNLGLTGAFTSGTSRALTIGGVGVVPADAAGISGNLTIVNPATAGFAFISPTTVASPKSSTINVVAHLPGANGFDVGLSGGSLSIIWVGAVGSTADVQLDVTGYWS